MTDTLINLTAPPVYRLILDEGGFRQELWQKIARSKKIYYWLGLGLSLADILLLCLSFPAYDFSDFTTFLGLGIPAGLFLRRNYLNQNLPDYYYYQLDTEKIEYFVSDWQGIKTINWADVRRVHLNDSHIELVLKKSEWSRIKLDLKHINQTLDGGQTVQELKLAFRSFCIRMRVELIEFPDCRREQAIARKIKKKLNRNTSNETNTKL
ncbi:MAG: hypothetical protein MUE85_24935 [Microscillaceae bacterium]|jgi:hypothetical protein|nr:hypothetical protein [Microscillaceae bacterium]